MERSVVAIVGIGCRFPGRANSPDEFWRLLEKGFDAIAEPPPSRAAFLEAFDPDPKTPGHTYTRRGGFLERIDLFDAQFFGISPREAAHIDPQHRLLLELAWEACEDAGISPHGLGGSNTGVFIGISTHDYGDIQMYPAYRREIDMHTNIGTATSIAANRISYAFDLRGPSVAIDTACSSSLSAVHFACQSLHAGECDLAIVGGAQILLAPELTIGFSKASMLSREGACRAFDAGASGYVRSEGAGIVVLEPLSAALERGDPIWAVIRATAVNQDGRTSGITVPSPAAQQSMIESALRKARMSPSDIQYVEAHGTGTPVGDPIEARAIGAALARGRTAGAVCAIGSVKTNLGHLEAASGIAGLIKVALALRHRRIPPSIHFDRANEAIDLNALGLRMVTESEAWPASESPAAAGVNSFGFGGANAHVILQEAPPAPARDAPEDENARLLVLSARSEQALTDLAASYADALREERGAPMRDVCHTAAVRRAHHDHRLAVVAASRGECATLLTDFTNGATRVSMSAGRVPAGSRPKIAFVFSGMGPPWWGMGRQLRESAPVFRQSLEQCDAVLRPIAGWSLLDELAADEARSRVAAPELAHATNFAIQFALTELWASYGISPHAVIGHSAGATAAACVAGIHSLEEALFLAFHRSRLQGRPSNAGKMLAVGAPYDEIVPLLDGCDEVVSLAAVNAPSSITLAGGGPALERIAAVLLERQVFARFLPVTIAYHSPAMDQIKAEFLDIAKNIRGRPSKLTFVSDTTGMRLEGPECGVEYWWRAIREPVLFGDGIRALIESGATEFVEIGPHPVLAPSIRECLRACGHKGLVLPSLHRQEDERAMMLRSLGALYTAGCLPDWRGLQEEGARTTKLPGYPWQRERHWFEPTIAADHTLNGNQAGPGDHPLLGRRLRAARPTWECLAGVGETAYLRDHVVQGAPLCPGAAYVEQAVAARTALDAPATVVVRDLEFVKPLRIGVDGPTPIQFAMDPADGRFEIFSTPSGDGAAWICHARGSVGGAKNRKPASVDLAAAQLRCNTELTVDSFYDRLASRGLQYGPLFRGVRHLTTGRGEALGSVAIDGLDVHADYRVHPALLDAAFQVLVAAADTVPGVANGSKLFLPTKVGEVRFHTNPGPRFDVIATVVEASDAEVVGNLQLVGGEGQVCAEVAGLTARLFESAEHDRRDSLDQWLYEYRWELDAGVADAGERPGPLTTSALESFFPDTEIDALNRTAAVRSRETGWRDYDEAVEHRLDEIAAAWVVDAFVQLGCVFEDGASLDLQVPASSGWRDALRSQLCELLEREGFARRSGTNWTATGVVPRAGADRLSSALVREFPAHELDIALLNRCGPRIVDVLAGRADGRDVLFDDEGFALLDRFYRESPASAFYNRLAADVIAAMAERPSGRPLRVLEVGAGTGGTTSHVLPRLDRSTRYVFSDASPLFVDRARAKFKDVTACACRLLDMTRDAPAQGFDNASFDIVFAANAVHAVADVESAMRRLVDLLAPGGALILLEITRHPAWLDIAFGLMDDWWTRTDRQRRPGHPLMPGGAWRQLMQECGLESTAVISDATTYEPAQSIVFGRRPLHALPATITSTTADSEWVILADERRGVGQRLATIIESYGGRPRLVFRSDDQEQAARSIRATGNVAGLIHLWSLDAPPIGDEGAFEQGMSLGCGSALGILQSIVHGSPLAERTLFLTTSGTQVVAADSDGPLDVLNASLWGFGRVVRKEWPALSCRLIDLSANITDDELASFAAEIMASCAQPAETGTEEELAFRGAERYVHRLRPISRSQLAASVPASPASDEDGWRAEIATVGSLDSIAFRRCERPAPRASEVEVRIESASLNFRDVVVAMGAVPGLEKERTFGERRLGIDFAGVVTRCGEAVTRLKAGDPVLGIAQSAFASYAIADATLVVRRPSSMTAVEASTVPIAFVTAWYALRKLAQLAPGESVLIHAASGGVGFAAMQMARLAGARIFATVGSEAKRAFVEAFGVEAVMDSRSLNFADEIRERTGGRGVDVVLNSLAGEALERGLSALAAYGRFIELGKADIYQNQRVSLGPFRKNLSMFAVDLDRMCLERTTLVGTLLREVTGEFEDGRLRPPPCTEFLMTELPDALRFMAQAKHIGKVVVKNGQPIRVRRAIPDAPRVRRDGSYLITGGLGGLGLRTARWLIDRGAGAVVLMGRSSPSLGVEATLVELRLQGGCVETVTGDVSRAADVARVLNRIRTKLPPLRGVVHAAMTLSDRPLAELDRAAFDEVMAPKALGAWHLHSQTASDDLDFFVMFSSITAILGNPQQANYAAANACLDALAAYRRARGLPATSINWGVVTGAGYVARHPEIEDYLKRHGYLGFTPEQTLDILSELLRYDASNVVAARIDWRQFGHYAPGPAASPQLRHLVPAVEGTASQVEGLRALIERDNPTARVDRVERYLRDQVARLLGAAPATIDVCRAITEFGLDSLIAVELTVILERDLGIQISGTRILAGASVRTLAGEVLSEISLDSRGATVADPVEVGPAIVSTPEAGRVATMSAAQAAALVATAAPVIFASAVAPTAPIVAAPTMVAGAREAATDRPVSVSPATDRAGEVDYRSLDYSRWSPSQRAIRRLTAIGFGMLGRIDVRGLEHIPREGPCVLVVNHLSMADVPLMLTLLPRRAIILAVDELRRFPALDWFVSDMGDAIYVTRNQPDEEPMRRALTVLESGGMLALAPEGRRNRGGLGPGRTGAAYLAVRGHVPIVPLVAWGQERWRDRWKSLRRIQIHVRAGEPFRLPEGPASPADLIRHTADIMHRLAALLPPVYRGAYRDSPATPAGPSTPLAESTGWTSRF